MVARDEKSVTGHNLEQLRQEFSLDPWTRSSRMFKAAYKGYIVPEQDKWRLPLLERLLSQRREMSTCDENVESVTELIDSLCST